MKKAKKLAALVLAMVMAFSLMAVTAAAAGTEEHEHTDACSTETIQPRGPVYICPVCGSEATWGIGRNPDGTFYVGLICSTGHNGTTTP